MGPADIIVSWLPMHHDFGFFVGLMMPMALCADSIQIPPRIFAKTPLIWLRAISLFRGSITAGPPSAYDLISRRITDSAIAKLDLSCLWVAWVAAEPLFLHRLEALQVKLSAAGLNKGVISPGYGMAEGVAAVTNFRGAGVLRGIEYAGELVVDCGQPQKGVEVRVVDDSGGSVADNQSGEILIRGETVIDSYWGEAPGTRSWIETGDLGFFRDGHLFITGRKKDLIIRAGANVHPQWIEDAVESLDRSFVGTGPVRACAFARRDESIGRETVSVVIEVPRDASDGAEAAIRRAILDTVGIQVDHIHFCSPGTIPRTSSGKLQRGLCAEFFSATNRK